MKILIHSSLTYSLINFRGALLQALVDAGHQVVATGPDRDQEVERRLAAMGVEFAQVPLARAALSPLRDLRTLAAYAGLLRRRRPDVVIAYTQKPIIYSGLAARLHPGVHFHVLMSGLGHVFSEGVFSEGAFSEGAKRKRLLRWLVSRLYREGVRSAKTVFVFNADDRHDMMRNGIIDHGHHVVQVPGSGVDTRHFVAPPPPDGPPVVLMIARLMRDKGVYDFVEAARRVKAARPDVRFQILGRAEQDNPTGIPADECRAWSDAGLVEFLPETRDVRPNLATASLFVLPSFYREGLPRTILEALSCGRPVITTDLPGCREAIRPGSNGLLVPPRDPAALAEAVGNLLADPGRLREMGEAARRTAVNCYDVHSVNQVLLDCMGLARRPAPVGRDHPSIAAAGAAHCHPLTPGAEPRALRS